MKLVDTDQIKKALAYRVVDKDVEDFTKIQKNIEILERNARPKIYN
jgi:hypothetical protein